MVSRRDSSGGGSRTYDLVVLGGGTAGLVSSVIAASVGARVALVERDRTGGDCLWTGCVPSKSLIASARLAEQMRTAGKLGLAGVEPEIELGRVMDRVREAIATIEPHDSPERLREEGVEVIAGEGRFEDARTLAVGGRRLRFRVAIVATGSQPATAPGTGPGERTTSRPRTRSGNCANCPRDWSCSAEARSAASSDRRSAGSGPRWRSSSSPNGCWAGGARGERADRRAPRRRGRRGAAPNPGGRGAHAAATAPRSARRPERARRARLRPDPGRRRTRTPHRRPRARGGRGRGRSRRRRRVDERLRTTAAGIYAAGDVTGRLPFTHVAAHHARVASVNALFGGRRTVEETIPWVTFTDPEVARVGLSGAQARERWGAEAQVARSEYSSLDRAITDARAYGFALLVADPRGRLVGATVAAPGGGEAIAELAARVRNRGEDRLGVDDRACLPDPGRGPGASGRRTPAPALFEPGLPGAGAIGTRCAPAVRPALRVTPLTDGESWARRELEILRAAGYGPTAIAAFLRASRERAAATRRARPELVRQSRTWTGAGAAAWVALALAGRQPFRRRLASGLGWWAAVALMLDWHLGMVETEDGRRRSLGPADALTLGRAWLVPVLADRSIPPPCSPWRRPICSTGSPPGRPNRPVPAAISRAWSTPPSSARRCLPRSGPTVFHEP